MIHHHEFIGEPVIKMIEVMGNHTIHYDEFTNGDDDLLIAVLLS